MKKFFKILMVLALLSGAALSCTKDYSKEIADVQKTNQELSGLIAALQNAINSTNTTVSQVSALADKNEADIVALTKEYGEKIAEIITTHATDVDDLQSVIDELQVAGIALSGNVETLGEELEEAILGLQGDDEELAAKILELATSTAKGIDALQAEIAKKADQTYLDAQIDVINCAIKAVDDRLTAVKQELEAGDAKIVEDLVAAQEMIKINSALIAALQAMIKDYPEYKAIVQQNTADIDELRIRLDKEVADLQEQIDKNKKDLDAADKALQEQIDKLKQQIGVLSARLTNIVAAPARTIELYRVIIGDSTFVNLQMDFEVAPKECAKVIAEGFESGKVNVDLNFALGQRRTRRMDIADLDTVVTPFKVVSSKDGVISVAANLSGIRSLPVTAGLGAPPTAYQVAIRVSGTDCDGMSYERISDYYSPITGSIASGNILEALKWHKGDTPVTIVEDVEEAIDSIKVYKAVSETKEYAVAIGGEKLIVALADLDWKEYGDFSDPNVIEGYELKIPAEDNDFSRKPITVNEIAEMLGIEDYERLFAPSYKKVSSETIDGKACSQTEWQTITFPGEPADPAVKNLFSSDNKNALAIGVYVKSLQGANDVEKAEFVGAWYAVQSTDVVYGKIDTLEDVNVTVLKRIGKHVSRQEATDPLTVQYAYNAGGGWYSEPEMKIADHVSTIEFPALRWKSSTDIQHHSTRDAYLYEKGATYTPDNRVQYGGYAARGAVVNEGAQAGFVTVKVGGFPYQANEKKYELVWGEEPYENSKGVQAEDYIDYIDVTVKPYHNVVKVEATPISDYVALTTSSYFKTNITINSGYYNSKVFGSDSQWNGGRNFANATEIDNWNTWYTTRFGDEDGSLTAKELTPTVSGYNASNVSLAYNANILCVHFDQAPVAMASAEKTYTIHAVDTIDNVIAFDYTVNFTAKPIGATIKVRDGFPVEPTTGTRVVNVAGNVDEDYQYVINSINPANYFDFIDLEQINPADLESLNVKFTASPSSVSIPDYGVKPNYTVSPTNEPTPLAGDMTIGWGDLNATQFTLTGHVYVDDALIKKEAAKVLVQTETPVRVDSASTIYELTRIPGEQLNFNALEGLRIEGIATKGEFVGYGQPVKTSWSNVLNQDGTLKTEPYQFGGNYVSYGLNEKPQLDGACKVYVGGIEWNSEQIKTILGTTDGFSWTFKPESAIGTVQLIIPYKWNYKYGTLKFNRVVIIN